MEQSASPKKITPQHVKQCTDGLAAVGHLVSRINVAKYPSTKSAAQALRATLMRLRSWYQARMGMVIGMEEDIPFASEDYKNMKGRASTLYITASKGKKDARAEQLHKQINKPLDAAKEIRDWQTKGYIANVEFTNGEATQ